MDDQRKETIFGVWEDITMNKGVHRVLSLRALTWGEVSLCIFAVPKEEANTVAR